MTNKQPKAEEEIVLSATKIFAILLAPFIIAYALYILYQAYGAIDRRDMDAGFFAMYGSVFLSIAASCAYNNIKFIKIFFWTSLFIYTAFLIMLAKDLASFEDGSLIFFGILELIILIIYGIYYLIRIKNR